MYSGSTTGTTTTGDQYAFFINENGLPSIKKGSQVITFGTSGYAMQGSSGSSGANGSSGASGSSGVSGTSGQDGAPGSAGVAGTAGSSGESGTAGINGIDGANGSSGTSGAGGTSGLSYGSSGTSGITGTAGSSGASLAKVTEDAIFGYSTWSSNYAQYRDASIYFSAFDYSVNFIETPFALSGDTFESYTTNTYNNNMIAYSFLKGKKLTSITLDRMSDATPPTGKTETVTTSVYLKIWKGSLSPAGVYSLTEAYSYDLDGIIDLDYGGEIVTYEIDLSAENIQAGYNEFLIPTVERTYNAIASTSEYLNSPGINLYLQTVASGILGSNGTAGVSGTNGSAGSSGLSFGTSGSSGANGSAGSSGLSFGTSGSSGASGATGSSGSSGATGTSGTSAGGGGGVVEDTQYSFYVGPSADQPTLTANRHQWHSVYGDGLQLDQGNGGGYVDQEYGFVLPITLHAGETLDTLGVYVNETDTSGTAEMKLMIMDKHPEAFLPNNILQTNTLTWTLEGIGNKWVSWDMDFTNTGSTNETFFVWQLFSSKSTNPYDICRTVIYPPYLTYDYRQVGGYLYDNRFDKTGHWMTQGTSVYNSIPANFLTIMSSGQFTYTNDRGGHFYYQTTRP